MMAFCGTESGKIYYEVHGNGPPLLLVSGLGGGTWSWYGQVPYFSRRYTTIVFDNRGAGRSAMPPGPYTMGDFASDTLALLDHLGIDRCFLAGLSMGGMIAQETALLAPQRFQALALGCTHCGGTARIAPTPEVIARFTDNAGLSQEEIIEKNLPFFFSRRALEEKPDVVEAYKTAQLSVPLQPSEAFQAQLAAIQTFDCCDRLGSLSIPTLVVTGTEDVLVPPENARILAHRIPEALLVELEGAGHALHAECRDELNRLLDDFFSGRPVGKTEE
ncbi:Pimeloyl-ACP methyl ester carboxylesterase [Desulfacinum hydrothermale DSM 13146]|uniref:Pimeloyl-ACP methyl ester carboxylesterase n=1 Tax=Desulfacinum hydrothermale DSM 13146 TaxID=1121390 RepID=A0A1W1X0L6_9BACT|nr:alpha/beta fold hydrolase [Desulfacinum hydrothermale]SMC16921.1 Pimeloyl-ACP methyl ester carboxylesterase [Desulfacinum hydrothermale DSM 13146]